jgi:hypothetical protein
MYYTGTKIICKYKNHHAKELCNSNSYYVSLKLQIHTMILYLKHYLKICLQTNRLNLIIAL